MTHRETNPHFIRPLQPRDGPHSQTPPSLAVSPPQHQSQHDQPPLPWESRPQGLRSKPKGPRGGEPKHDGPFQTPQKDSAPRQPQYPQTHPHDSRHDGEYRSPWVITPRHPSEDHHARDMRNPSEDHHARDTRRDGEYRSPWMFPPQPRDEDLHVPELAQKEPQDGTQMMTPPQHHVHDREREDDRYPLHPKPPPTPQDRRRHSHGGLRAPAPQRTRPITWLVAAFCAIFWIVIFLGGLIVLILYLVYRPRSPLFEVSSATLSAAYIDAGSLLNADISILANFTNPNKKASVDFNHMVMDLYYGTTLIGTQYIESFSAARTESRFANVHVITSQVRLPLGESVQLQDQMNRNAILFNIKVVFRVRSNLGSFLRYSYRLYGHCTIMVAAPPTGVLRATRCRTKH